MKHYLILLLLIVTGTGLAAQGIGNSLNLYSAMTIPDSLKKDANAVYRLDEAIAEVQSPAKYTLKKHKIVTLLNKDAGRHLAQYFYLTKFRKVEDVEVTLYNSFGIEIKKYKKKDFQTTTPYDEITLVSDLKLMVLEIPTPTFPCTIEVTSEEKINSYISLPHVSIGGTKESVQQFSYTITMPTEQDIRYKVRNINLTPEIIKQGTNKTYKWETRNLLARSSESHTYNGGYYAPQIEAIPNAFEYDGFKGEFTSWKSYGDWTYKLFEDNAPFSPTRTEQIKELVKNCKTDREKISLLYSYLQKNMRYVSIQLGIGGLKPFAVSFVDEKKYGDCKALSNYMRYMLKVVGINSYPALINSDYDSPPADPGFASDPFNHVILCVPMEKDSVWLECTDNEKKAGFLGNFTENKNALLITEQGGVLVPTPRSKSNNNILNTRTVVTLNKEAEAGIESSIYCSGDFYAFYSSVSKVERERQKTAFVNYLNYKVPDAFQFAPAGDSANGKLFHLTLSYEQLFDFRSGNKLFFRPRVNKICDEDLKPNTERKTDYLFEFPYEKSDTTIYILPAGFSTGSLPAAKEIKTSFGYYKNEVIRNEQRNEVIVISHLSLKKNIIPAAEYSSVADFFKEVNKNEAEKLIITTE
ncbi:MAG: DUF3857 domain-containing protein [Chitinophagaceae bacterium]